MAQDFKLMQDNAIRAAREMKKRAQPVPELKAVKSIDIKEKSIPQNPNIKNINANKKAYNNQPKINPVSFPDPLKIFGKRNPWTREKETPFCNDACPIKNILGIGKSGGAKDKGDNEALMLMSLMLLLASDGGDKVLMLALLYIMM